MAVVLSLLTSLFFGVADFAGGAATRRTSVLSVVAGAHTVGLVGISAVALVVADEFDIDDLGLGALAGAFGGLGIVLLYRGLARGPMAVVAPLTAVASAIVPIVADTLSGESFSGVIWVGMALALVAIAIVSAAEGDGASAPVTTRIVAEALVAGVGFGAFFVVLDQTDASSAPWPIVGARILTTAALGAALLARGGRARRMPARPARLVLALIVVTGLGDTIANTLFLYATLEGDLAIVSVLSSLYPVVTAGLAATLLGERPSALQVAGAAAAVVATALIASG